jgi:hypothetical protein
VTEQKAVNGDQFEDVPGGSAVGGAVGGACNATPPAASSSAVPGNSTPALTRATTVLSPGPVTPPACPGATFPRGPTEQGAPMPHFQSGEIPHGFAFTETGGLIHYRVVDRRLRVTR